MREAVAKKQKKLDVATDIHAGLEILHLFIIDLLGRQTPAARIFETKSEEDFKHARVVTRREKYLAVAVLLALNGFFVYFSILTGFRKGVGWQQRYILWRGIVQFAVEICLFETMECAWINCVVPALVSEEVRTVGESIKHVVYELCNTKDQDPQMFLNAPDFLFVSTNLAKKFPHLMESVLVQSYYSPVPGELSKAWQVGSIARIRRHGRMRGFALLSGVLFFFQYLGTAPFIVHRMFIRFTQPFVFSGLAFTIMLIVTNPIFAVVLVIVALSGIGYYLARRHRNASPGAGVAGAPVPLFWPRSNNQSALAPIAVAGTVDDEDEGLSGGNGDESDGEVRSGLMLAPGEERDIFLAERLAQKQQQQGALHLPVQRQQRRAHRGSGASLPEWADDCAILGADIVFAADDTSAAVASLGGDSSYYQSCDEDETKSSHSPDPIGSLAHAQVASSQRYSASSTSGASTAVGTAVIPVRHLKTRSRSGNRQHTAHDGFQQAAPVDHIKDTKHPQHPQSPADHRSYQRSSGSGSMLDSDITSDDARVSADASNSDDSLGASISSSSSSSGSD